MSLHKVIYGSFFEPVLSSCIPVEQNSFHLLLLSGTLALCHTRCLQSFARQYPLSYPSHFHRRSPKMLQRSALTVLLYPQTCLFLVSLHDPCTASLRNLPAGNYSRVKLIYFIMQNFNYAMLTVGTRWRFVLKFNTTLERQCSAESMCTERPCTAPSYGNGVYLVHWSDLGAVLKSHTDTPVVNLAVIDTTIPFIWSRT